MASQTPNLDLTKQDTGSNEGTWGAVLNDNFQKIDDAWYTDQSQALYVGKHGLDTNDGKTVDKAFLTFGAAITAAGTPGSEAAAISLVCHDDGAYTEDLTHIPYVYIYAPNATIKGKNTFDSAGMHKMVARRLENNGADNVVDLITNASVEVHVDVDHVIEDQAPPAFNVAKGTLYLRCVKLDTTGGAGGSAVEGASGVVCHLDIEEIVVDASKTGINTEGSMVYGRVGRIHGGSKALSCSGGDINLVIGEIDCTTAIQAVNASAKVNVFCSKVTGAVSEVNGGTARINKAYRGTQILYVGKHGADTNTGKSVDQAFLTFGAAITAAGTPAGESTAVSIICQDTGEYTEDITGVPNVHIHAPNATIIGETIFNAAGMHKMVIRRLLPGGSGSTVAVHTNANVEVNLDVDHVFIDGNNSAIDVGAGTLRLRCRLIEVTEDAVGIATGGTSVTIIDVEEVTVTANTFGISANTSTSEIFGRVGRVHGAGSGVQSNGGELNLVVGEIDCTAVAVQTMDSASVANILCSKITGAVNRGDGILRINKAYAGTQILHVGKHGADTNSGRSVDQAFLTFGAAITAAGTPASEAAAITIVCYDDGEYAENLTHKDFVFIYAPNATIKGGHTLSLGVHRVVARRLLLADDMPVLLLESGASVVTVEAEEIVVSNSYSDVVLVEAVSTLHLRVGKIVTDARGITVEGGGIVYLDVDDFYVEDQAVLTLQSSAGSYYGRVGRIHGGSGSEAIRIGGSAAAIMHLHIGEIDCTTAWVINDANADVKIFCAHASGTRTETAGSIKVNEPYATVQTLYVGKHGADTNSGRSVDQAFLTFGAAITAAGTPAGESTAVAIVCQDDGLYDEDLTHVPYVYIQAPSATLKGQNVFSSAGLFRLVIQKLENDGLNTSVQVTHASAEVFVDADEIDLDANDSSIAMWTGGLLHLRCRKMHCSAASGGDCISVSGSACDLRLNVDEILIDNTSTGINALASGKVTGRVGYIHGAGTALDCSQCNVDLVIGEIDTSGVAVVVDHASAEVNIFCPKVTGTITETAGILRLNYAIKNNYTATTDPGVSDDSTDGYSVGSEWINVTTDMAFSCADASTGAAVWPVSAGPNVSEEILWLEGASAPSEVFIADSAKLWELDAGKELLLNFRIPEQADLSAVDPKLVVPFAVSVAGSGAGDVDLSLEFRYIAVGDQVDKAADETLTPSPVVVNTVEEAHEFVVTLDRTLIADGDKVSVFLENLGTGSFDGNIGIWAHAQLFFRSK